MSNQEFLEEFIAEVLYRERVRGARDVILNNSYESNDKGIIIPWEVGSEIISMKYLFFEELPQDKREYFLGESKKILSQILDNISNVEG